VDGPHWAELYLEATVQPDGIGPARLQMARPALGTASTAVFPLGVDALQVAELYRDVAT